MNRWDWTRSLGGFVYWWNQSIQSRFDWLVLTDANDHPISLDSNVYIIHHILLSKEGWCTYNSIHSMQSTIGNNRWMMDKLLNRYFDREESTLAQQRVMSNRWCQWNTALTRTWIYLLLMSCFSVVDMDGYQLEHRHSCFLKTIHSINVW